VLAIAILSWCARGSVSSGRLHFRLDNSDEDAALVWPLAHKYQPTYEHFSFKYVSAESAPQIDEPKRFPLYKLNRSLTNPLRLKSPEDLIAFQVVKAEDVRTVLTFGISS
jgi:hypothetical protein